MRERDRGHAIPVKAWWLRLARSLVVSDPRGYIELGKALALHVKSKTQPFSGSQMSSFGQGKTPATLELVEALCKEFSRLPPPVFFPASYEECAQMLVIAERYAGRAIEFEFEAAVVPLPAGKERRPRRRKLAEIVATVGAPAATRTRRAR